MGPGDWSTSGHTNRIFGMKFLPKPYDNVLISCGW